MLSAEIRSLSQARVHVDALAHMGCPDFRIDRLSHYMQLPFPILFAPIEPARVNYAASATGSRYFSPRTIMAQAMRTTLFANAMAATFVGRRASNAANHGRLV